jgi:BirA family transcriptional regulator, biotin operon repressor / biotin---[acetyl-CoA-carboxylase] ligase
MIIGSNLMYSENLPSTNSHAASLLRNRELPEGCVIYTNYQSAGRGQAGNSWESEENKNLLISIILYPNMINPADQFQLSMVISLGICDFLQHHTDGISIKWPNDIYVNDDKIAGILIENSIMGDIIEHTIAGIGLNINQLRFISGAPNPVSLSIITGVNYDLQHCLMQLTSDLDKRYKCLISGDSDKIKSDYVSCLYRRNQLSNFRDENGLFTGCISGVSNEGRLKIELKDGSIKEYSFKEIELLHMR